ncbi:MAG: 7-cyano-7-deazaguanine synthase QueC [Verrucomicrobia bacterium]|nr:7-cyano-7-deazaguanine synthase QueC [Verrucomicrobiota bacterium]
MKIVVLLSGGIDSVTVLYDALQTHHILAALSFDYGAKHNARELCEARWHCDQTETRHEIIALPFVEKLFASDLLKSGGDVPDGHYESESMKQTVVPFRNAIMLSIATGFAESIGAQGVAIAAHGGDHAIYPDCRESFMAVMGEAMRSGTYANIQLLRPFINMNKMAIVQRGSILGVPFKRTWSCYRGGEIHCGTCGTCCERREAFILSGFTDPTVYQAEPALPRRPGITT